MRAHAATCDIRFGRGRRGDPEQDHLFETSSPSNRSSGVISGESRFPLHARSNGVVMSRKWTLLTLILSLCSSGALQANPLDLPGIVYIDGLPCNSACQSYMAASARALAARHREERETVIVVPAEAVIERVEHAARPRVARQPLPVPRPVPRAGMAASNANPSNSQGVEHQKDRRPQARTSNNQEGNSGGHGDMTPEKRRKPSQEARRRSANWKAPTGRTGSGSLHRRVAVRGGPQFHPRSSPRSPCRRQPRSRLPRRLLRPRTLRCPPRLAVLPLRPPGQYSSRLWKRREWPIS